MSDKKDILDYLPFYLGGEVLINSMGEDIVCRIINVGKGGGYATGKLADGKIFNNHGSMENAKLLLRRLSDMTEEEWYEIAPNLLPETVAAVHSPELRWQDKPRWVLVLENRVQTNTLSFLDGIQLLKRSYDVFGLIDADLAIETKTPKP